MREAAFAMAAALRVLTQDTNSRKYLEEHDPMALKQALQALAQYEEAAKEGE